MDTIDDILSGLNKSLEDDPLNLEQFRVLIKTLKTNFKIRKRRIVQF
jgi:hypothetical protein